MYSVCVVLWAVLAGSHARTLPSFIHRCKYTTAGNQVGDCINKVYEDNKERFLSGVPELQLPSLDPLAVDKVILDTGNGTSVGLNAVFTGVRIVGAKSMVLKRIDVDIDKGTAQLDTYFPTMSISADYHINGKILIMQLDGAGRAEGNYTDIYSTNHFKGNFVTKNNKQYIKWVDRDLTFKIGGARFYFHDLFKDNPTLTDSTNRVINDNALDIINELKPLVEDTISSIIFTILNRVFTLYSLDELFII